MLLLFISSFATGVAVGASVTVGISVIVGTSVTVGTTVSLEATSMSEDELVHATKSSDVNSIIIYIFYNRNNFIIMQKKSPHI